jgi:hypothetical protein
MVSGRQVLVELRFILIKNCLSAVCYLPNLFYIACALPYKEYLLFDFIIAIPSLGACKVSALKKVEQAASAEGSRVISISTA